MPKSADFEKVHKQFVGKYGDKQGDTMYFAWLNSFDPPLDDTKPMPDKLPPKKKGKGESIDSPTIIRTNNDPKDFAPFAKLFMPNAEKLLESLSSGEVYFVPAIHVGTTGFPGMTDAEGLPRLRQYSEDELMRSARTLIGKPVNLNHAKYPDASKNFVIWAEYDAYTQGVMSYLYVEDKEINLLYDEGQINAASVEYAALDLPRFDGIAPTGILFSGIALLTKDVIPGDPKTSVDRGGFPIGSMVIAKSLVGESAKSAEGLKVMSEMEGKKDEGTTTLKEWDDAYRNDLPDSAFAFIETGGQIDAEGKTAPRSIRHLPYRKKDDSVDVEHLKAVVERFNTPDLAPDWKASIKKHLDPLAKQLLEIGAVVKEYVGEAPGSAQDLDARVTSLSDRLWQVQTDVGNSIADLKNRLDRIETVLMDGQVSVQKQSLKEALSSTAKVDNPERKDADKKEPDKQEGKEAVTVAGSSPAKLPESKEGMTSNPIQTTGLPEGKGKEGEGGGKEAEVKETPKGKAEAAKVESHGVGLVATPDVPNPATLGKPKSKHKAFLDHLDQVVAGQSLHERHVVDLVHEELDNEHETE